MKLLLDTNALIWWLSDDRRLGPRARRRLTDQRTITMATIVSIWEVTMKHRSAKMRQSGSSLLPILAGQQIELLGVRSAHICAIDDLLMMHSDPFDHLILAQAKVEGATLMTSDVQMTRYGVPCIGTD